MLNIETEYGSLEVGKRADIVIFDGDPLKDITEVYRPFLVIKSGEVRTPDEWFDGRK